MRARFNSVDIQTRGVRGGSHSVTMRCNGGSQSGGCHSVTSRNAAGRAAPGMRAVKSSEFGEGE